MKNVLKSIVILGYFLLVTTIAMAQGSVSIHGQLIGFPKEVAIQNLSEFQYLLPVGHQTTIIPDASGKFSLKMDLKAAGYFGLGRNTLYLTPGDNLQVSLNYDSTMDATFSGKGKEANIYLLKIVAPKGGSYVEGGLSVKENTKATIAYILQCKEKRDAELKHVINVSPEFKRLEAGRNRADVINSLSAGLYHSLAITAFGKNGENIQKGRAFLASPDSVKAFTDAYKKAIAPVMKKYSEGFIDLSLLQVEVYRYIAEKLIPYNTNNASMQRLKDYYKAVALVEKMQTISGKEQLALLKDSVKTISTPIYRNATGKMLVHFMAFGKGDVAVDFTAVNYQGEQVSLSSLKGKVIYVDLWATWCMPCLQEMPYYEKLKDKFKDNPEVVFVSLSIDDGVNIWKKNIDERKATGNQWLINRTKLKSYDIVGVPRSLLIGKDFKIVDMDAPAPSNPAIIQQINALLN